MAYDPGNYTMQRTSSALKGAQAGAALGSAVLPGWGGVAGGVIGGAGGFLMGGPSEAQRLQDEYLKKLYQDAEMGTLGLTEEERRQLEANLIDPLRAQERQNRNLWAAQEASSGLSTGDMQRMQLAREADSLGRFSRAQQQINAVNTEMALAQRAALQKMLDEKAKQDAQIKKEIFAEATNLAGTAAGIGTEFAEMQDLKAREAAMGLGDPSTPYATKGAMARAKIQREFDRTRSNIATQWGLPPGSTKEDLEKVIAINESMGVNKMQTRMARNLLDQHQYAMSHADDGTGTYNPYDLLGQAGLSALGTSNPLLGGVDLARYAELEALGLIPQQDPAWNPPGLSQEDYGLIGDIYK